MIYPNPVTQTGPINVHIGHLHPGDRVELKVYTTAFRKILEKNVDPAPGGPVDVRLEPGDFKGGFPANGVFYVRVRTRWETRALKLMILR